LNSSLIFVVLFAHLFLAARDQTPSTAWRIHAEPAIAAPS
jgi:hypothetical protein